MAAGGGHQAGDQGAGEGIGDNRVGDDCKHDSVWADVGEGDKEEEEREWRGDRQQQADRGECQGAPVAATAAAAVDCSVGETQTEGRGG